MALETIVAVGVGAIVLAWLVWLTVLVSRIASSSAHIELMLKRAEVERERQRQP